MTSEEATRSSSLNKRQKDECTIDCLPVDVIERVFLSLPFSNLLRCSRVRKHWRQVIQDPHFVQSHLKLAPRYVLLFSSQETVSHQLYPSDAILINEASQSTMAVPVLGPDEFLFGPCNGLLAIYTKASTIKIANFSTGQCLHLEKPVKNLKGDHFSLYTFGFHPVTKQYKITHFLRDGTDTGRVSVIQVYTLGDEEWKDIPTPDEALISLKCLRDGGVVNIDATLYWLTGDMAARWEHVIMSFDPSEESFARIQLPAVLQGYVPAHARRFWVREIDGNMCIATAQIYPYNPTWLVGKLEIWALDDIRDHTWSHKYNIQCPSECILGPVVVLGNRIFMQHRNGNLYSYELSGANYDIDYSKKARSWDLSPRRHNLHSHNCVKSLVRLDVFKTAGIVRMPKQREGWGLKKWQSWEQKLSKIETMWCKVHQQDHKWNEFSQSIRIRLNCLLPRISDGGMRQHIGMTINQIFLSFSNQQARSLPRPNWAEHNWDIEKLVDHLENLVHNAMAMAQRIDSINDMTRSGTQDQQARSIRRLNWVEHKRDVENLFARLENLMHITMPMALAIASIEDVIRSATQDQNGTAIPEASIGSHNHSDDVDTVLRLGSSS